MVETISLGTPTGRDCMTRVLRAVPREPPIESTPPTRPSFSRLRRMMLAPSAMVTRACALSPFWISASILLPAALAICWRLTSAGMVGPSSTPVSITSAVPPSAQTRSRRNATSGPLVSSEPRMTTCWVMNSFPTGYETSMPCCSRSAAMSARPSFSSVSRLGMPVSVFQPWTVYHASFIGSRMS